MKKQVFLLCIGFLLIVCPLCAQEQVVSLRAQDGWDLSAVYRPAGEGQKTVVLLHDIGKNHKAFQSFIDRLTSRGIGYLALDLRGHGGSTRQGVYSAFAKEGVDNDYNKMTRDVNAAMEFLKGKNINPADIVLIGVGMGANVAAKSTSLWPEVGGLALITPVTNFRDVLPIPALRVYKGLVFIAAASDDKKTFLEASVMRNVAFLSTGEGNITFATAYDKKGHELLDAWVAPELVQWLLTPKRPDISPDIVEIQEEVPGNYTPVEASATEEALVPSVLL